jgi:hypothetical protein
MKLTISTEAQAGFDYIAVKEGVTAADLITKFVEEKGLGFAQDKARGELEAIIAAVVKNPAAYKASIEAIKVVEDAKEAEAALEPKEG